MVVGSLTIDTDVVVIGSGPGGYVAALRAAQLGKDVYLVEKENVLGGVCLNWGCVPTKALITASNYYNAIKEITNMGIEIEKYSVNSQKMVDWTYDIVANLETGIRTLCKKFGVEVITGVATFTDKNTVRISGQSDVNTINFKNAIIATGSSPIQIPGFEYNGNSIISSNEALKLTQIPQKMAIIGGGYIGTEMATVYGKLGCEVHILEGQDRLISVIDKDVVEIVAHKISEFNVQIHLEAKAKSYADGTVTFDTPKGEESIKVDKVLVVVGRKPNSGNLGLETAGVKIDDRGFIVVDEQMKTSVDNIFAIGDVVGQPMLAHKASREGKVAAEVICGEPSAFDNKVIPAVVFNDPEIVSVGLCEQDVGDREVIIKKFPYTALARSHFEDRKQGFIKIVADKKTHFVLGVHAVGPHVSEIVGEATLAIEMSATLEDLSLTIHPHPTISEGLQEVADAALDKVIHIYQGK